MRETKAKKPKKTNKRLNTCFKNNEFKLWKVKIDCRNVAGVLWKCWKQVAKKLKIDCKIIENKWPKYKNYFAKILYKFCKKCFVQVTKVLQTDYKNVEDSCKNIAYMLQNMLQKSCKNVGSMFSYIENNTDRYKNVGNGLKKC